MISTALGHSDFYLYVIEILLVLFVVVRLGHRVLDLMRDARDFLNGH